MLDPKFKGLGFSGRTLARLPKPTSGLLAVTAVSMVFSTVTLGGVGDPSLVTYQDNGVGVANGVPVPPQINYDPQAQHSQALTLDLGDAGATAATLTVSRLLPSESKTGSQQSPKPVGECGQWEAFGNGGALLGSETFIGTPGGPSTLEVNIAVPDAEGANQQFRFLVFTALPYGCDGDQPTTDTDSSDYFVESISFNEQSFPIDGSDAAAWAGLQPTGFDFGTAYKDDNGFLDAPIIIDENTCEGGIGGGSSTVCEFTLGENFQARIEDSGDVMGKIALSGNPTFIDHRSQCGGDGMTEVAQGEVDAQGNWNLGYLLDDSGSTGPVIPYYLCGIEGAEVTDGGDPNYVGIPHVVVLDIDSGLTSVRAVLEGEIDELNPDYVCTSGEKVLEAVDGNGDPAIRTRRSKLPVVGWLPKTRGNPFGREIPELDGTSLVTELQDLTTGCGSIRPGRFSYIVHNLHHLEFEPGQVNPDGSPVPLDYMRITESALARLNELVYQTAACIDPGNAGYIGMSSTIASARKAFSRGELTSAKLKLQKFLYKVGESRRMDRKFEVCLYDLRDDSVFVGSPDPLYLEALNADCGPGWEHELCIIPRNFRGDLVSRTRHALYMFGRMLGVTDAELPDDFPRPPNWGDSPGYPD